MTVSSCPRLVDVFPLRACLIFFSLPDEEMQDAAPTPIDEAEAGSPIDKAPEAPAEEDKPQVIATTISGGRRRGRRRVMKKKTTRDEEGYLGT